MSRKRSSNSAATVLLTSRALSDLHEVEEYSRFQWGEKTAAKYLKNFEAALDLISENPDILQHEPAFSNSLYFYRVRKHYLVCDVRELKVIVLTVIHTSMEIPSRLAELEPRLSAEVEFLHDKLHGTQDTSH